MPTMIYMYNKHNLIDKLGGIHYYRILDILILWKGTTLTNRLLICPCQESRQAERHLHVSWLLAK